MITKLKTHSLALILALPFGAAAVHAVAHVGAALFGVPCP